MSTQRSGFFVPVNPVNRVFDVNTDDGHASHGRADSGRCSLLREPSGEDLCLVMQNIRSASKNFDKFLATIETLKIVADVICLTEVWIKEDSLPLFDLDDYELYHCLNNDNRAGGVMLYVRDDIVSEQLSVSFTSADCVCVGLTIRGVLFVFLCVYRLHGFLVPLFLRELSANLDILNAANFCLLGDINIDTLCSRTGGDYEVLLAEHGLHPLVEEPTRLASATCLDHVCCRSSARFLGKCSASVHHLGITDHSAVTLSIQGAFGENSNRSGASHSTTPKLKIDYAKLNDCLRREAWEDVMGLHDVNVAFEAFMTRLTGFIDDCSTQPSGVNRRNRPIKPWITPELCKKLFKKNELLRLARENFSNERLANYSKAYSERIHSRVEEAKISYYSDKLQDAGNDYGKCWRVVNEITGRAQRKTEIRSIISREGEVLTEQADICNEINDYFVSVVKDLSGNDCDGSRFPANVSARTLFVTPATPLEVLGVIRNLKSKCAPGSDGIDNTLLKRTSFNVVDILTHLINLSLKSGTFPEVLKNVLVVPIFKKGDKRLLNNYRPITLVSSISKVIEKIVYVRMYNFMTNAGVLSPAQFGFRSGHGCEDAMCRVVGQLNASLNRPGGTCASVLFLDLTKAFDLVRHSTLLEKLESMGFRGVVVEWLRTYLSGRVQRVKLGSGCISEPQVCEFGVPQGSVLGPLLFLIYINLLLLSDFKGSITAYADDLALFYCGNSRAEVDELMRIDLEFIRRWCDAHGMILSSKTVLMEFGRESQRSNYLISHSPLCCRDFGPCTEACVAIHKVHQFKYLGLIIDSSLTWRPHIDALVVSVRQATRQLYALRKCCPAALVKAFYYALIESRLRYGIVLWGNACENHVNALRLALKSAIRVMSFAGRLEHSSPLFAQWGILQLQHLYVLRVAELCLGRGPASSVVEMSARGRERYLVPRPFSESFKRSLNFSAPTMLNNLTRALPALTIEAVRGWISAADCDMVSGVVQSLYNV